MNVADSVLAKPSIEVNATRKDGSAPPYAADFTGNCRIDERLLEMPSISVNAAKTD